MLVVPVADITFVLMPVVLLVANILMPDPRKPNPPILSLPPVGHWRSEDKHPTKLYLLQENSVMEVRR